MSGTAADPNLKDWLSMRILKHASDVSDLKIVPGMVPGGYSFLTCNSQCRLSYPQTLAPSPLTSVSSVGKASMHDHSWLATTISLLLFREFGLEGSQAL